MRLVYDKATLIKMLEDRKAELKKEADEKSNSVVQSLISKQKKEIERQEDQLIHLKKVLKDLESGTETEMIRHQKRLVKDQNSYTVERINRAIKQLKLSEDAKVTLTTTKDGWGQQDILNLLGL